MEVQPWTYNPSLGDFIDEAVAEDVDDGWLIEHRVTPDLRAASLRAVFLNGQPRWQSAFTVMLALSAGVATLGLSQNSAATVIGSMVIAPLGQPHLVVSNIGAARAELMARGTEVSEPFHYVDGSQMPGADLDHTDYATFFSFEDPDGNGWLVQEVGWTPLKDGI